MPSDAYEVIRCPADMRTDALALVLSPLAPSQRRDMAAALLEDERTAASEPLYVAVRQSQLRGAAWGQRQPGNVATFWPPQLVDTEDRQMARELGAAVVRDLDRLGVDLAQSLLLSPDAETIQVMQHAGFRHITDLLYLCSESVHCSHARPATLLEFEEYKHSEYDRLVFLVEQSYEGTLDCTALDGKRDMEDVMNGYRATGVFHSRNWLFAKLSGQDVGVLLMADHPAVKRRELVYMGLISRARGRGLGRQLVQHAQWLTHRDCVERLLVAVDTANLPAAAVYRGAGFEIWEQRAVFLRFLRDANDSR